MEWGRTTLVACAIVSWESIRSRPTPRAGRRDERKAVMVREVPRVVGAAAFGVVLSLGGCFTNDARDSHCTPSDTKDDRGDCIYAGEGKGPQVVESECPRVSGDEPAVCPTFEEVLEILADPERGGCLAGGCHGVEATASVGIHIPSLDPDDAFAALVAIEGSVGRPYVDPDDPPASWIVCNLAGEPGGGFPMPIPYGLPDLGDVDVVRDWVLCGAPPPRSCEPDASDGACGACGRDRCCEAATSCATAADCAPCAQCLATGDPASCVEVCDPADEVAARLLSCLAVRCREQCPVEAP
jgi:hypothetical protein